MAGRKRITHQDMGGRQEGNGGDVMPLHDTGAKEETCTMRIQVPVLPTCLLPYLPAMDCLETSDAHGDPTIRTCWTVDARSGSPVIHGLAACATDSRHLAADGEGIFQASGHDILHLRQEDTATIQARCISNGSTMDSRDLRTASDPFTDSRRGPGGRDSTSGASLSAGGFTRGGTGVACPASTGGHASTSDLAASTGAPDTRTLDRGRPINGSPDGDEEGMAVTPAVQEEDAHGHPLSGVAVVLTGSSSRRVDGSRSTTRTQRSV